MPADEIPSSGRKPHEAGADSVRLPREGGHDLLLAALDVLGGEDHSDRHEPWSRERFEQIASRQTRWLADWSDRESLWVDLVSLGSLHRGRREHDILGEGTEGHVFKITRGAGFGLIPEARNVVSGMISEWFSVLPGTPQEYLCRLALCNRLFPGLNSLEGFCETEGRFAIVTSQPFVAGRNSTPVEIQNFLAPAGFAKLCEATWYRQDDRTALFDVSGSNMLADENGDLVPTDIIPVQAEGFLRERLEEALAKTARRGPYTSA